MGNFSTPLWSKEEVWLRATINSGPNEVPISNLMETRQFSFSPPVAFLINVSTTKSL